MPSVLDILTPSFPDTVVDADQGPRLIRVPQALNCKLPTGRNHGTAPQLTCPDRAGETFTVDSTITSYRMENGRRYHAYKEGTYW
jgi:hypothetical protein